MPNKYSNIFNTDLYQINIQLEKINQVLKDLETKKRVLENIYYLANHLLKTLRLRYFF